MGGKRGTALGLEAHTPVGTSQVCVYVEGRVEGGRTGHTRRMCNICHLPFGCNLSLMWHLHFFVRATFIGHLFLSLSLAIPLSLSPSLTFGVLLSTAAKQNQIRAQCCKHCKRPKKTKSGRHGTASGAGEREREREREKGVGQTPIMAMRAHDNCTLHYP